jgi:hypothetical protein
MRATQLHAVLGAIVVTIGFWLVWGELPVEIVAAIALGVAGFLAWRGSTPGRLWAWACLLLGAASAAWPLATMIRIRRVAAEPSDEQMGLILTAVVMGLFSSVFWTSFAFGIFRWIRRRETEQVEVEAQAVAADKKRPPAQSRNQR